MTIVNGEARQDPLLLWDLAPLPVTLWDGTRVLLRPLRPGDEGRLQQAYAQLLSTESRYNRFWRKSDEMPVDLAARLTATDGVNHVAWAALNPDDEQFPAFGAASFWRDAERTDRAELSFTIADDWQRRGFATLLFSILWFDGWRTGLRGLYGFSRPGNVAIRDFWRAVGGREVLSLNEAELTFDLTAPEEFVERVAFEMEPGPLRHDVAVWMQEWLVKTGEKAE